MVQSLAAETMVMTTGRQRRRWLALALFLAGATGACVRLDPVENPGRLPPDVARDGGPDAHADAAGAAPDAAGEAGEASAAGEAGAVADLAPEDTEDVAPPDDGAVAEAVEPEILPEEAPEVAVEVAAPDLGPDLPVDRGAVDAGPDPLRVGLVAHWRFDEGMGNRAEDATGNRNVATLMNGAGWEKSGVPRPGVPPEMDFAIKLDGQNDFLTATVITLPALEASKTVAFFLARANEPAASALVGQRTCLALLNVGANAGLQIGIDRGMPAVWQYGQNQGFVSAKTVPAPGYHHIAYSFAAGMHRLYVDGVLVATTPASMPAARVTSLLVGTYEAPFEMCGGSMDDLRIYDRALTEAEVARLAAR